nr:RNA-dependent RNA polymerase [Molussus totiviridae 2]
MSRKHTLSASCHFLAKTIKRTLGVIKHLWKLFLQEKGTPLLYVLDPDDYIDDYFRQKLKTLSGWAFVKVFEEGPAYMFLTHLHALTGKAPYTDHQIETDIENWVSPNQDDGKKKQLDKKFWDEEVGKIFSTWYRGEAFGFLSFKDFCNDPYRWGTSGGAKATVWLGSKYRTKWAWAYERMTNKDGTLKDRYDLYAEAEREYGDQAEVALKEEAQKTREIITTPMPSYLRQAYLLYRWGKPNISSPVANPTWVAHFETICPKWFGCLDGERFDQSIPCDIIIDVVERLGKLDDETKKVAELEVKHLKKLRVHWKGISWRWLGGLLSGWRLTSLIGSLVSEVVARYIIKKAGLEGGVNHGVLGDDIVLYSSGVEVDKNKMVECTTQPFCSYLLNS